MKKIGIYYGSTTGTTQEIAERLATALEVAAEDVHDVSSAEADSAEGYDLVVLGSSTWGEGEMQDDWYDFIGQLKNHLQGKEVALFGLGDSGSYETTFCDAVGLLYDELQGSGCTFLGATSTDGYQYGSSKAERDGKFVGLLLDEINESDLTDERIANWVSALR